MLGGLYLYLCAGVYIYESYLDKPLVRDLLKNPHIFHVEIGAHGWVVFSRSASMPEERTLCSRFA